MAAIAVTEQVAAAKTSTIAMGQETVTETLAMTKTLAATTTEVAAAATTVTISPMTTKQEIPSPNMLEIQSVGSTELSAATPHKKEESQVVGETNYVAATGAVSVELQKDKQQHKSAIKDLVAPISPHAEVTRLPLNGLPPDETMQSMQHEKTATTCIKPVETSVVEKRSTVVMLIKSVLGQSEKDKNHKKKKKEKDRDKLKDKDKEREKVKTKEKGDKEKYKPKHKDKERNKSKEEAKRREECVKERTTDKLQKCKDSSNNSSNSNKKSSKVGGSNHERRNSVSSRSTKSNTEIKNEPSDKLKTSSKEKKRNATEKSDREKVTFFTYLLSCIISMGSSIVLLPHVIYMLDLQQRSVLLPWSFKIMFTPKNYSENQKYRENIFYGNIQINGRSA